MNNKYNHKTAELKRPKVRNKRQEVNQKQKNKKEMYLWPRNWRAENPKRRKEVSDDKQKWNKKKEKRRKRTFCCRTEEPKTKKKKKEN